MEYAEWFFWIHSANEGSSISRYKELKQVEKTLNRTPEGLANAPTLPEAALAVWDIFFSLDTVSFSELQAREALTGEELGQWEIDAIMGLKRLRNQEPSWPKKQH